MKVAVTVTKVITLQDVWAAYVPDLAALAYQFERKDYEENGIDWYNVEADAEIWSYAILEK